MIASWPGTPSRTAPWLLSSTAVENSATLTRSESVRRRVDAKLCVSTRMPLIAWPSMTRPRHWKLPSPLLSITTRCLMELSEFVHVGSRDARGEVGLSAPVSARRGEAPSANVAMPAHAATRPNDFQCIATWPFDIVRSVATRSDLAPRRRPGEPGRAENLHDPRRQPGPLEPRHGGCGHALARFWVLEPCHTPADTMGQGARPEEPEFPCCPSPRLSHTRVRRGLATLDSAGGSARAWTGVEDVTAAVEVGYLPNQVPAKLPGARSSLPRPRGTTHDAPYR